MNSNNILFHCIQIALVFLLTLILLALCIRRSKEKSLMQEIAVRTELNAANADLLHLFYKQDTTYWNTVVVNTPEYKQLDSLKQGDWEDFYLY